MRLVLTDLLAALAEDTAFVAAVAARVYLGAAASNAVFPYVVYSVGSTERPKSHDQRASATTRKADTYTIVLSVVSNNGDDALDVAEVIDNCLDGRRDLTNTAVVLLDDMSIGGEFRDNDSAEVLHVATLTFLARRKAIA